MLILTSLMAILLIGLAGMALYLSNRKALDEKTNQHFMATAGLTVDGRPVVAPEKRRQTSAIERLFKRAGVEVQRKQVLFYSGITVLLTLLVLQLFGVMMALAVPVFAVLFLYLWLWQRANSRVKAILTQLPLFLDQVLRALSTGRSMESALQLATEETPRPLKEIFERVLRANRLGHDLGQSIQQMAELYRVQELYLVALAIRVNRSYGTSVRDLLNNVVKMIHDREAARRELRTMTGETRVTAWVLGLLPIAIAGYIVMMNPGYMMAMWEDASGKYILIAALGFQALGGFILWRMIKSI